MKIELNSFEITLPKPLKTRKQLISLKKGYYLYLQTHGKTLGIAELSPLEGFSLESLQEAFLQCQKFKNHFLEQFNNFIKKPLLFKCFAKTNNLYPSVAFSFYSLLLQQIVPSQNLSLNIQGLIYGEFEEILKKAQYDQNNKFTHIKVKVERFCVRKTIQLVQTLLKVYGKTKKLRLDFGCSWKYDNLQNFLTSFDPKDFDYLEDPVSNLDNLLHLNTHYKFFFGLDELLRTLPFQEVIKLKHLKSLIIKPMLDMSYLSLEGIPQDVSVILSSSYETPIGLRCIAILAKYLKIQGPHGLDTLSIFPPKLYNQSIVISAPSMIFQSEVL